MSRRLRIKEQKAPVVKLHAANALHILLCAFLFPKHWTVWQLFTVAMFLVICIPKELSSDY